ncbi:unnamed protein product [Brassica rapa subsp. narinosa]
MPDWSLLPEELLHFISQNVENCFDGVHGRSVCTSWRSNIPFPSCLRDESEHLMELPSPLQCSVKVNIPGNDPALLNVLDCQIFPLGHQCRMIGWDLEEWRTTNYRGVAFLPLNNGEFIVLLNFTKSLFMSRSAVMRWIQLKKFSDASCEERVPFRGGIFSVSKLDDEAGKWVEVSDVGGRVLFIGYPGNVSCCAKELPDGSGLSGNSLLFTGGPGNVTYSYKYGVNTGREEDDLSFWRFSGENRVTIINTSPVVALQVER